LLQYIKKGIKDIYSWYVPLDALPFPLDWQGLPWLSKEPLFLITNLSAASCICRRTGIISEHQVFQVFETDALCISTHETHTHKLPPTASKASCNTNISSHDKIEKEKDKRSFLQDHKIFEPMRNSSRSLYKRCYKYLIPVALNHWCGRRKRRKRRERRKRSERGRIFSLVFLLNFLIL